jgi:hypothetical protein
MLTAVHWDEIAGRVQEAMGIVLLMAATRPASQPVDIPGLASLSLRDCVDEALREVRSWDLALAVDLPDLARLRVLLSDVWSDLDVVSAGRGLRRHVGGRPTRNWSPLLGCGTTSDTRSAF